MKKLSYLFAVAASAACLCACTDVTDALPAEQIPADARSTLGADVVLQWNNEEQTIDGFGVAQAGWSDYLYAHRKRQEIMDVMFGQDGLRLSILRGEVFPHYDETTFNMDEDINLSLDDPFFDIDFNRDENRVAEGIAQRNGQLWIMKKAKQEYGVDKLIFSVWSALAYMKSNGSTSQGFLKRGSYQAFADYLHQNLLQPAGLEDTYTPSDDFDRDLLAKTYLGEDTRALPPETLNAVGTGGIYATAADLAAFGGALCGEGLLTQASLDAMAADESVRGMWPAGEDDALAYGLGWDSVRMYPFHSSGVQALVKGGDTQLYHGGLIVLPEYDMAVAGLSSGGSSLYNQAAGARILMDALAERGVEVADDGALPQAQPVDMPADAQAYAGRYGDSMGVARVEVADDHLTLTLPALLGGASLDLFPYSDGTFRDEANSALMRLVEEDNGRTYLFQKA